ncbi:MAG: hypothetical protein AAGF74_01975 [Pseudomonadota bacterium]
MRSILRKPIVAVLGGLFLVSACTTPPPGEEDIIRAEGTVMPGLTMVDTETALRQSCLWVELTEEQIEAIRARPDFERIFLYVLENCPEVALLLGEDATGTIVEADDSDRPRDDDSEDGVDGGGPSGGPSGGTPGGGGGGGGGGGSGGGGGGGSGGGGGGGGSTGPGPDAGSCTGRGCSGR